MSLDAQWAMEWMLRAQRTMADHRVELIELDRAIGDADHGENLDRGFTAVAARMDVPWPDVAAVFRTAATTLMSTVGGAAGPLYGTAFLRAAHVAERGDGEVTGSVVADVLAAALQGIQARGKAVEGEKTMVDAWAPAVRWARDAAAAGADPVAVLRAAAGGAAAGSDATIPMIATKGRASYLGERSAGHRDPGSRSSVLLLEAAADTAEERR